MTRQMVGTSEAAELLGVTPRTVYRLANEGRLPIFKVGRVFRIRISDLDAFLDEHQVKPGGLDHLLPNHVDARDERQR